MAAGGQFGAADTAILRGVAISVRNKRSLCPFVPVDTAVRTAGVRFEEQAVGGGRQGDAAGVGAAEPAGIVGRGCSRGGGHHAAGGVALAGLAPEVDDNERGSAGSGTRCEQRCVCVFRRLMWQLMLSLHPY